MNKSLTNIGMSIADNYKRHHRITKIRNIEFGRELVGLWRSSEGLVGVWQGLVEAVEAW